MNDLKKFTLNNGWEIETDKGWQNFAGIAVYNSKSIIRVNLSNGKSVRVSENHGFIDDCDDIVIAADSLNVKIKTCHGLADVVSIEKDSFEEVYDVVEVEGGNKYYTNGILSHNTHLVEEFWKSVFPIITSSKKSKVFICSTANGTDNLFHKIYDGAEKGDNGWGHDRIMWDEVPGRDEKWAAITKQAIGSAEAWLQEFCSCSAETLIDIEHKGSMQLINVFNEMEE